MPSLEGFFRRAVLGQKKNPLDPDDIKSAIYAVIKRFGATTIFNATGIPRTTLYDMYKDESNSILENLCKVLNFLKVEKSA